jgi:hypothetical protein
MLLPMPTEVPPLGRARVLTALLMRNPATIGAHTCAPPSSTPPATELAIPQQESGGGGPGTSNLAGASGNCACHRTLILVTPCVSCMSPSALPPGGQRQTAVAPSAHHIHIHFSSNKHNQATT